MRLDDGRVIHMWQFRDITARRQAEQEIIDSAIGSATCPPISKAYGRGTPRSCAQLHDELGQL